MEMYDPQNMVAKAQAAGCALTVATAPLTMLLKLAYFLSLQTEESRPVKCTLILSNADRNLAAAKTLDPTPPASIPELRRLAFTTHPSRTCIHIRVAGDNLVVHAIAARPQVRQLDGLVEVEIVGPARLRVATCNAGVAFEGGEYLELDGRQHLRDWLPEATVEAILKHCTELTPAGTLRLGRGHAKLQPGYAAAALEAFQAAVGERVATFAVETLYMLVARLARLGHGASILVLATQDMAADGGILHGGSELHTDNVRIDRWTRGLIDTLAASSHYDIAVQGTSILAELEGKNLTEWREGMGQVWVVDSAEQWRRDTERCADLAQIDGALVLDAALEPVRIGVKITAGTPVTMAAATDDFLKSRGTRHTSVAKAAGILVHSLGIAVSQDSSVTLFKSTPGEVSHRALAV